MCIISKFQSKSNDAQENKEEASRIYNSCRTENLFTNQPLHGQRLVVYLFPTVVTHGICNSKPVDKYLSLAPERRVMTCEVMGRKLSRAASTIAIQVVRS